MDLQQLRGAVRDGQRFSYLFFWGARPSPGGALGPSCMSQWYASPFVDEGVRYETAEHYMMAAKARLFEDERSLAAILRAPTPRDAKRLGREVRGFTSAAWETERFEIVVRGNVGKFGGDPRLRAYLLGTGDALLVEASPMDRIWGVGMGVEHPEVGDPLAWRGLNLLGFALMEARERLK